MEADLRSRFAYRALDRIDQAAGHPFVSVDVQHPIMLEADVGHRPVEVSRPVVEGALDDRRTGCTRDVDGAIGAERIEHVHIVAPPRRVQACGEIDLFVLGEDEDRDAHAPGSRIRRSRIVRQGLPPQTDQGSMSRMTIEQA